MLRHDDHRGIGPETVSKTGTFPSLELRDEKIDGKSASAGFV